MPALDLTQALSISILLFLCAVQFMCQSHKTFLVFKPCLHCWRLRDNAGNSDSHHLLALATLGGTTKIEMILSVSRHPRWPRQVRTWHKIANDFANKFCKCKRPITHSYLTIHFFTTQTNSGYINAMV